jgi:hypothetical protein
MNNRTKSIWPYLSCCTLLITKRRWEKTSAGAESAQAGKPDSTVPSAQSAPASRSRSTG